MKFSRLNVVLCGLWVSRSGPQFAIFLSENWEPPLLSPSYILSWTTIVNISAYFKCILTAAHVKMKPHVTIQGVHRDLNSMYIYIHLVRLMKSSVSEPGLIRGWYFLKSSGNAILSCLQESPLFEHNLQTNKTRWNWTKASSNWKHPLAANQKKIHAIQHLPTPFPPRFSLPRPQWLAIT